MRRVWLSLTIVFTFTVVLLFLSGHLTGMENRELQDPYSRLKYVYSTRYGVTTEREYPNPMSEYYYGVLAQPQDRRWQPSDNSYRILSWFRGYDERKDEIAPIMLLDIERELAFLKEVVPNDKKIQVAVIRSLYTPRRKPHEPNAEQYNRRLMEQERARTGNIANWYQTQRQNPGMLPGQWWRENAQVFGLTEKGDPLPEQAIKPQAATATEAGKAVGKNLTP